MTGSEAVGQRQGARQQSSDRERGSRAVTGSEAAEQRQGARQPSRDRERGSRPETGSEAAGQRAIDVEGCRNKAVPPVDSRQ